MFQRRYKSVSIHLGPSSPQQGCTPSSTEPSDNCVFYTKGIHLSWTFLIKTTNKKTHNGTWLPVFNKYMKHRAVWNISKSFKLILDQWQNSDLLDWLQRIHFWHCLLHKQPYITCDSFYQDACESHNVFLVFVFFPFMCSLTEGT